MAHTKTMTIAILLLTTATGVQAQDQPSPPAEPPPAFRFQVPLNEEQAKQFLESILSTAIANVRDYVEFESPAKSGDRSEPSARDFRLRIYPKGKSRSGEHFTAEGSLDFDLDHPRSEFRFRFEPAPDDQPTKPHADGDPV